MAQMKPMQTYNLLPPPPPRSRNLKKSSARATRRASTLFAISVLIALAILLSFSATASAQSTTDYDSDNDGYIDVKTHQQLNAIRYDLDGNGDATHADYVAAFPNRVTTSSGRMGCPSGTCTGYELMNNIDLDTDGDGNIGTDTGDAYYNGGNGWQPIGTDISASARFQANFKGNGYTINNLFINRNALDQGLFGSATGRIETLGVTNANVTGISIAGILLALNRGSAIVACYTTGKIAGGSRIGGLVGSSNAGSVASSYSTAYVSGTSNVGGVLGYRYNGSVTDSYSTGRVVRSSGSATTIGGLIGGERATASGTVSNNYWDTSTSGQSTSAGGSGVVGKTTRQLQTPTDYTGIYANWNADLDNADNDNDATTGKDNPWTFGNKMQYPMLQYKMMSTDPQGGQAMGIPDNWNAPIVGERVAVCVTAATRSSRSGGWQWEKSTNGDTWTALSRNSGATYEYYPVSADVGSYLRAKAPLSGGGFAYTRALGGRVKQTSAATAGSAISFVSGNTSPRVGQKIQASDPAPTGAVDRRYSWQRCDNADTTYTDCSYIYGVWWTDYTPTTDDLNKYLRMVVYYATSGGVWTRHASGFTGQVAAASQ